MIIKLPDADALTETALRLYFDAWDRLRSILADWDSRIPDAPFAKPIQDLWKPIVDFGLLRPGRTTGACS